MFIRVIATSHSKHPIPTLNVFFSKDILSYQPCMVYISYNSKAQTYDTCHYWFTSVVGVLQTASALPLCSRHSPCAVPLPPRSSMPSGLVMSLASSRPGKGLSLRQSAFTRISRDSSPVKKQNITCMVMTSWPGDSLVDDPVAFLFTDGSALSNGTKGLWEPVVTSARSPNWVSAFAATSNTGQLSGMYYALDWINTRRTSPSPAVRPRYNIVSDSD